MFSIIFRHRRRVFHMSESISTAHTNTGEAYERIGNESNLNARSSEHIETYPEPEEEEKNKIQTKYPSSSFDMIDFKMVLSFIII